MKGVVLAGGSGSRLLPLTEKTNKHLLPVGGKPMITYPIRKLVEAGLTEILVVTGTEHLSALSAALGDGSSLGCRLEYLGQERPGGIAEALALARSFAAGDKIAVILGDNLFEASIAPLVAKFKGQAKAARVVLKEVRDPSRYGIAEVHGGRILGIVEKPADPASNLCVTGIYFYGPDVFDVIAGLARSPRGELEISDVNQTYVSRDELGWDLLAGWWIDAGTPESLRRADELMRGGAPSDR